MRRRSVRRSPWFVRGLPTSLLVGAAILVGASAPRASSPLDVDGDGHLQASDCDDADSTVWGIPGPASGLTFAADGRTLAWQPPADPGGLVLRYDLLRSTSAFDFLDEGVTDCAAEDASQPTAVDPTVPPVDVAFFYLPVAGNDCGDGPPGPGSNGIDRVVLSCDCPSGCDDADSCTADSCGPLGCEHTVLPPTFLSGPPSIAVCDGDTAHFNVTISGQGVVHFQWKVDGVDVGTDSAELSLPGLTGPDDGAEVTVEVTDACAATVSGAAVVTVFPDPASCLGGGDGPEAPNGAGHPFGGPVGPAGSNESSAEDGPARLPRFKNTGSVQLHSGEYVLSESDLRVRSRGIDFAWARTYRSREGGSTAMGEGWDFSYNLQVSISGADRMVRDGTGRQDLYVPDGPGCWRSSGVFATLCELPGGEQALTHADGTVWTFSDPTAAPTFGKVMSVEDRNGNLMGFTYDLAGRLVQIDDTLGRSYLVGYDAAGRIASVSDFDGRTVQYTHYGPAEVGGSPGDLRTVTSPAVTGTPNGDDFPGGKTTTYTYATGLPEPALNHNLLTITDPRGVTFLENTYTTVRDPLHPRFDRIDRQTLPDGSIGYAYVAQQPLQSNRFAVSKTVVNDRMGNVRELLYDALKRLVIYREHTGRAPDPSLPTGNASNRPISPLRPGDPALFQTAWEWNADFLPTRVIYPGVNIVDLEYDSANPDPRLRGNRTRRIRRAGVRGASPLEIEETWGYAAPFGGDCGCEMGGREFWTTHTDARGGAWTREFDAQGNLESLQAPTVSTGVLGGGNQVLVHTWDHDSFGRLLRHTHPDGQADEYTYHVSGPQAGYLATRVLDADHLALTWSYAYDARGNVLSETDPEGNTETWVYNPLDQIVRHVAPAPFSYVQDFFHDENDELCRVEQENRDENGAPLADAVLEIRYFTDVLGRRLRADREVSDGVFAALEYGYDGNGNQVLERSGEAVNGSQPMNVTTRVFDERDLLFRETRGPGGPDASTDRYDWDGNRNLVVIREGLEDPGGAQITTHDWDGHDRLRSVTDPEGNVTRYTHDAAGNVLSRILEGELIEGESGQNVRLEESTSQYDEVNRRIRVDRLHFDPATGAPIGDGMATLRFYFDQGGRAARTEDDRGNGTDYSYDTAGRLSAVSDEAGNQRTFGYDGNTNLTSLTFQEVSQAGGPPAAVAESFTYDELNRVVQVQEGGGETYSYAYDSLGNITVVTDPRLNVSRYSYDGLERLVHVERTMTDTGDGSGQPLGVVATDYLWDDNSRLIAQMDDNGNVTSYEHDALDRAVRVVYADGTFQERTYDVHGNVVAFTNPDGTTGSSTFDRRDRLVGRTITPAAGVIGTTFEVYKYDGVGHPVWAADDDSRVIREYDSLSNRAKERLLVEAGPERTITRSFDGAGNLLSVVYPGGRALTRAYDGLNRLRAIREGGPPDLVHLDYRGTSRLQRRDYRNGVRMTHEFDATGRMTRTTHVFDPDGLALTLADLGAAWNASGHKILRSDLLPGGATRAYEHDSLGRLMQTDDGGTSVDYGLDGAGNRTSVVGGPEAGTYTMDAGLPEPADFSMNQYTSTPFDGRTYDPAGNLLAAEVGPGDRRDLVYDYRNQIVELTDAASGLTYRYAYDALGRRVQTVVDDGVAPPVKTRYFYDGWRVLEEQSGAGLPLATYVHGNYLDEVLSMRRDTDGDMMMEDYFYHHDEMGNVIAITDASGAVVERYEYDDFGAPRFFDGAGSPLAGSALDNPFLFSGRRFDETTGLYYYRNRYLDPRAGRFLTRDPIGIWGDPSSVGNGYTFAGNDPVSSTDPLGLLNAEYKNCGSDETTVRTALSTAEDVTYEGYSHFGRDAAYIKYFDGKNSDSRYTKVRDRITRMKKIFYSQKITVNCKKATNKGTVWARTWTDGKNWIALYKGWFDNATTTGTYGQPVSVFILNHEIAHEAQAKSDNTYCPWSDSACLALAKSNPKTASNNADNYQIFLGQYYAAVVAASSGSASGGTGKSACEECLERYPESVASTKCEGVCGCDMCPGVLSGGETPRLNPSGGTFPDDDTVGDRLQPGP